MKLRSHKPSTRLFSQPRNVVRKRNLGRWIYIGLLTLVTLWALDVFFGKYFFLRGYGLVVAQPVVVASEYVGTVRDITVVLGQEVKQGDVIAQLSSRQYDEHLARLRLELSKLDTERVRVTSLLNAYRQLVIPAKNRLAAAIAFREKLEDGMSRGVATGTALNTAYEREYDAYEDIENVTADIAASEASLLALERQEAGYREFIKSIRDNYDQGRLVAPAGGVVVSVDTSESSVISPGTPVVTIATGVPYVLGYFEDGFLYDIEPGQQVVMTYGSRTVHGTVEYLRPLSEQLPEEFQKTFQPTSRAQIAVIGVNQGQRNLPLYAKLEIGSGLFGRLIGLIELLVS